MEPKQLCWDFQLRYEKNKRKKLTTNFKVKPYAIAS